MATIEGGKGSFMLAAMSKDYNMAKVEIGRPAPGPDDVAIDLKYCGMCHSDLHTVKGEWGNDKYPLAPGHELGGVVREVGAAAAAKFKVGERVSVGCFVRSCLECVMCQRGLEQHCLQGIQTYGGVWPAAFGHESCVGNHTNGGYSTDITVHQNFVLKVPEGMALEHAGVLCCAGITMFSPLSRHVLGKPDKVVGIVGFGGLGMMGVKLARAMGAKVTVFSRSDAKRAEAEALGADLVVQSDEAAMKKLFRTFDVILDTVSNHHDINDAVGTLKAYDGTYVLIGGVLKPYEVKGFALLFAGVRIEGSLIGGLPLTQEMLDFCAKHNIVPDIEIINAKDTEAALKALDDGSGGAKRFVIDISTLSEL